MKTVPLLPYPIGNHLSDKACGGDRTSAQGGFIGKGDIELLKFVGKQIIQLEIKNTIQQLKYWIHFSKLLYLNTTLIK